MKRTIYSKPLRVIFAGVWILSVLASILLTLQSAARLAWFNQQLPVALQAAQPSGHGPYSYSVSMGFEQLSQNESYQSPAQLLEDGRALGPGNTLHAEIGAQGGGRFSFWKGSLIFSASDNSDPRTNGRHYILVLPRSIATRWLALAWGWVLLLTLLPLVRYVRSIFRLLKNQAARHSIWQCLGALVFGLAIALSYLFHFLQNDSLAIWGSPLILLYLWIIFGLLAYWLLGKSLQIGFTVLPRPSRFLWLSLALLLGFGLVGFIPSPAFPYYLNSVSYPRVAAIYRVLMRLADGFSVGFLCFMVGALLWNVLRMLSLRVEHFLSHRGIIYSKALRVFLVVLWLLSSAVVLLLWLQTNGLSASVKQSFLVPVQAAQPSGHGPYSYSVPMGIERLNQTETFASPAALLEDGRPLGPGNALHAEIGTQGGGRFSFWKDTYLYFSSSDNSDPRANGRQYTLVLPVTLSPTGVMFAYFWVGLLTLCILVIIWQTMPRMWRGLVYIGLGVSVMVIVGVSFRFFNPQIKALYSAFRTQLYIVSFDPAYFERQGSDYCNPRFNPERIGKPREEINATRDYDFTRLAQTRAYLWGVDRRTALKYIFDKVTGGAQTNTEKHLALLRFLQKASYHNYISPIETNGSHVFDPLVYLELGEMWCGNITRVAVDLFAAAGYKGRIVQLSDHQIAELYYDNDWHYFDADLFSGGYVLLKPDGAIPSVDELSRYDGRTILDSMPTYFENSIINSCYKLGEGSNPYGASYAYFSSLSYDKSNTKPLFFVKKATLEQEQKDEAHYGWFIYNTLPDAERVLEPLPLRYAPSIVNLDAIVPNPNTRLVHLSFHAKDQDNDLKGYRIYISKEQRGWDYAMYYGSKEIEKYWSNPHGWKPEMYDAYHRLPPADVALLTTPSGEVDISLPEGEVYYVSIMAYDAYGEQVGRKLYPASNEIRISWEN